MFTKVELSLNSHERQMRFEVLADLVGSYYIYMDGKKRHSRISETLLWGSMTTIARHSNISAESHNEHVVPLSFIFDHCFKYLSNIPIESAEGISNQEIRRRQWGFDGARSYVLEFLIRHLVVVIIPKELANEIDSKEKGFKTKMPNDWKVGDCVFSRLFSRNCPTDLQEIYREYLLGYNL